PHARARRRNFPGRFRCRRHPAGKRLTAWPGRARIDGMLIPPRLPRHPDRVILSFMATETRPTPKPMNLYVIDDHPLMREAVVMLMRRLRPGSNVVELERLGGVSAAVRQHGAPNL